MAANNAKNDIKDILTNPDMLVEWLIQDFLPKGSIVAFAGEAGHGKSAVSYHLAMAMASGLPALGGLFPANPDGPQRVLYFDQENSKPDRNQYLKWVWRGLRCPDIKTLEETFWSAHFVLGGDDWPSEVERWIKAIEPAVVFFDTATPCFRIEDENDNAEATATISKIRELMAAIDPEKPATAIVLKHAKTRTEKDGKMTRRTIRGAKAWEGAVDAIIYQIKHNGRPSRSGLSLTRIEPAKTRAFGLRQTVFIKPSWTDDAHGGLVLDGSYALTGTSRANDSDSDSNGE